ncbi:hypothetical protein Tco_0225286, partial [Tanacetum coccineum]
SCGYIASCVLVYWAYGYPKSDQLSDISSVSIGYGPVLVSLDMGQKKDFGSGYMASVVYIGSGFVILSDLSMGSVWKQVDTKDQYA